MPELPVDPARAPLATVVAATLLVLLLARLLGQAAAHLTGRQRWLYALFFAPGVALHELAHVFGCLLVGARVREVVLWRGGVLWVLRLLVGK